MKHLRGLPLKRATVRKIAVIGLLAVFFIVALVLGFRIGVGKDPVAATAMPTGFPPIEDFRAFAEALAGGIKKWSEIQENDVRGGRPLAAGHSEDHEVSVVHCDYKKTDSLIHPVVAVALFHQTSTSRGGDSGGYLHSVQRYTIQFAFDDGKWIPVAASTALQEYKCRPKSEDPPPIGEEEELNIEGIIADVVRSVQAGP